MQALGFYPAIQEQLMKERGPHNLQLIRKEKAGESLKSFGFV